MKPNNLSRLAHVLAIAVLMAVTNSGCAWASKHHAEEFQVDEVGFSPEFALVRERSRITVSVKLSGPYREFQSHKLLLQQQTFLPNGREIFKPIAVLRDDGKKSDAVRNDGIYTGTADFQPDVLVDIRLRVVAKTHHEKHRGKFRSEPFTLPVKNACGPTAALLPAKVLEPAADNVREQLIEFGVPGSDAQARETVLRLVNGARIGAPMHERLARADIRLNGGKVMRLDKSVNAVEIPVSLTPGVNRLEIDHIRSRSGQLLAVEIEACADRLELTPIGETLLTGTPLVATASLTAQGVAVAGAEIQFTIDPELAAENEKSAVSSDSGVAQTEFTLVNAGNGQLSARVADASPELSASTEFLVLAAPSLKLNKGFEALTLAPGDSETLPFFLFYLSPAGGTHQLTFSRAVEPDNGGLTISGGDGPAGGLSVSGPASFAFEPTVTAAVPGDYRVTATAVDLNSGETVRSTTLVRVVDPNLPEPLTLNKPGLAPSGIVPGVATSVTVRALAEGTTTPPANLWLDEVDADGNLIALGIAELTDDGLGPDSLAGDYIYSGLAEFNRSAAQDIYLRLRADYFGQQVVSDSAVLSVTPFALEGPPPDNGQLVPGPTDDELIYADEILVKLVAGTAPARAETIAASINGEVLSVIPEIQLYRIRFATNGTFEAVLQAIADLEVFSDVIYAIPNSEVTTAGSNCAWQDSTANCPQDPAFSAQWHLNKIRAKAAWNAALTMDPLAFAGSPAFPVAVIDVGLDCGNSDLVGQCLNSVGATDVHGTAVAGLIAANADSVGGTGVAWNSKLLGFLGGTDLNTLSSAIVAAGNSSAKVLNISMATASTTGLPALRDAACTAADKGRLVVAGAGQVVGPAKNLYPAYLNADKAYTCNSGLTLASYVLAVGATSSTDGLALMTVSGQNITSNFGSWVEVYAPGQSIVAFSASDSYFGTSFAAPQVSGAAAMIWPLLASGAGAQAVHDRLLASAVAIADLDGNGAADKRLDLLAAVADNRVTINFVAEDAAFRNLFGIYDRVTHEAKILVENVDLQTNPDLAGFSTSLYLTDQKLTNMEFFLIPNGAARNATYLQNTPAAQRQLEVFQDGDGKWRIRDTGNNTVLFGVVGEADALFSEPAINPDPGRAQTQTSGTANNYHLHWEDRPAITSDNDYNDAEFSITVQAL